MNRPIDQPVAAHPHVLLGILSVTIPQYWQGVPPPRLFITTGGAPMNGAGCIGGGPGYMGYSE